MSSLVKIMNPMNETFLNVTDFDAFLLKIST